MDWDNDYYTFSDTNIEYIWTFLKEVHSRGWLYKGHRSTQWCPRCGTSLSQHEQAGEENYIELEHPSLFVRFPLLEREGRVARRLDDDAVDAARERRRGRESGCASTGAARTATGSRSTSSPTTRSSSASAARSSSAGATAGRSTSLPAQHGVEHRVIPWDDVALDEGTGIVHIAPGAGAEDFELARIHGLPVLAPIDEAGRMLPEYGELAGLSTGEVEDVVVEHLRREGVLEEAGRIVHRYPICWRCKTPLVFRVVDDWFISADARPAADARRERDGRRGSRRSTASGWTTGCATWATGTSRASATSGCRCPSIRASAAC